MSYFYGPVPSRRLGLSLGLDLICAQERGLRKICSFNCTYCQLGQGGRITLRRFSYADLSEIEKELKKIVARRPKIDYITISGSGEPTLHKDLGGIIRLIKRVTKNKYPVCLITNSSLLYRKEVRRELKGADLIIPSLDAASARTFLKINRPHKGVKFKNIIKGLIDLRREFKGKIWLEIMLLGGVNDTFAEAEQFKKIIEKIRPDKVQINLPVRPPLAPIKLPDRRTVQRIKRIIGGNVEVVGKFSSQRCRRNKKQDVRKAVLNFLKIRPARINELESSIDAGADKIRREVKSLIIKGEIRERVYRQKKYLVTND